MPASYPQILVLQSKLSMYNPSSSGARQGANGSA